MKVYLRHSEFYFWKALFKTFLWTPTFRTAVLLFHLDCEVIFWYAFFNHKAISFLVRDMKSDFLEKEIGPFFPDR
jgi:hypothetical protein